jgi:hypothetical protein
LIIFGILATCNIYGCIVVVSGALMTMFCRKT